jgi:growth factor-regulated tyrosine kinase substrate
MKMRLCVPVYFEGLQDRLTQLKDARAALDALREEHYERIRREEEEAARQRQMQMAHKLAIMRKKKHEYLEVRTVSEFSFSVL